jgi:hypothetical protein
VKVNKPDPHDRTADEKNEPQNGGSPVRHVSRHHYVEVGGIEPPSGNLPFSCSEHVLPALSTFPNLPYTTFRDRSWPEKCVISVSVCQFCVRYARLVLSPSWRLGLFCFPPLHSLCALLRRWSRANFQTLGRYFAPQSFFAMPAERHCVLEVPIRQSNIR